MTLIIEALQQGSRALISIAEAEAHFEAECLLAAVLKVSRVQLKMHPEKPLTITETQQFEASLKTRASGVPLAYIIGKKAFWTFELSVTEDVLVPRPETEVLVETVLSHCPETLPFPVLELGTGSGAIAIALALERPAWKIIATDKSEAALNIARANAAAQKCKNIEFFHGEWFSPVASMVFSAIISNPPYIGATDPHLTDVALSHEPIGALCSGLTGLEALTFIIENARYYLSSEGLLCLEHGHTQSRALFSLLQKNGYHDCQQVQDLGRQARVIVARG